jgi:integrase
MRKNSSKTRRVEQYIYTVPLTKKAQKMAENARSRNPPASAKLSRKRRSPKQPTCLTLDEKDNFFRAIKNLRDLALFKTAYHCGLRASEIGILQLSDYRKGPSLELDKLRITRLKGSISGEMPIIPEAARCIRAWLKKRGHAEGPLFLSRQRHGLSRARVFSLFRKYASIAKLPREKHHPHVLKHSAVTHLLERGESIIDTQRHVGHTSVSSTMRYVNLGSPFDQARVRRLAAWK